MNRHTFIPRISLKPEFQNDTAKFAINFYLMMKANRSNIEDFDGQYLALQYADEINAFDTVEDIIKVVRDYAERIDQPSKLSGWIISSQKLFESEWNQLPKYQLEEVRLCRSDNVEPPLAIVHYLNHISPQFCGFYFENILDYCIHGESKSEWQVQHCGRDNVISFSQADQQMIEKLCDESLPCKILLQSIKQSITKTITIESYDAIYSFIDAVKANISEINNYINILNETGYVQRYRGHKEYQHSVNVEGRYKGLYQHGEMDFVIGNKIIDAKACKVIHIDQWFAQLNIYRELYDQKINKLEIVSFLNNRVYCYTI